MNAVSSPSIRMPFTPARGDLSSVPRGACVRRCSRDDHRSARPSVYTIFSANGAAERASPSRRLSMSRAHCASRQVSPRRGYHHFRGAVAVSCAPGAASTRWQATTCKQNRRRCCPGQEARQRERRRTQTCPRRRRDTAAVPAWHAEPHGMVAQRGERSHRGERSARSAARAALAELRACARPTAACGADTDATREAHDGTQLWEVKRVWRGEQKAGDDVVGGRGGLTSEATRNGGRAAGVAGIRVNGLNSSSP